MGNLGKCIREIRIHHEGQWRVAYVANIGDLLYVLHAFQKKGRKTSGQDVDLIRTRYQEAVYDSKRKGLQ